MHLSGSTSTQDLLKCTCLGLSADVLIDDELDRADVLDLTPIVLDACI